MPPLSTNLQSVENTKTATALDRLFATKTLVKSLQINPLTTNTGAVKVGLQDAPQGVAPITLTAGDGQWIDLNQIRILPAVSGEGVSFIGVW